MTRSTISPRPSIVSSSRPCGRKAPGHPTCHQAMTVDYSLAEHLEHTWFTRGHPSRRWTAAVRASLPNRHGFGFTRTDFARDARSWTWVGASLLSRADSMSVAGWATRSHVPDIAYTFWLGAQTVGLRDAWPGVPLVSRAHRADLYAEAHGWHSVPFPGSGRPVCRPASGRIRRWPNIPCQQLPRLGPRRSWYAGLACAIWASPLAACRIAPCGS